MTYRDKGRVQSKWMFLLKANNPSGLALSFLSRALMLNLNKTAATSLLFLPTTHSTAHLRAPARAVCPPWRLCPQIWEDLGLNTYVSSWEGPSLTSPSKLASCPHFHPQLYHISPLASVIPHTFRKCLVYWYIIPTKVAAPQRLRSHLSSSHYLTQKVSINTH